MKTLTLPAKMENLETLIEFVLAESDQLHFDSMLQNRIRLATEEVLANVISYAYPDQIGDVSISTERTTGRDGIRVEISDSGIPFDPLGKPEPDLSIPLEKRQLGGLGIFLVKEIANDVSYHRKDGKNILTFTKYGD